MKFAKFRNVTEKESTKKGKGGVFSKMEVQIVIFNLPRFVKKWAFRTPVMLP